jgi:hypothetical protein
MNGYGYRSKPYFLPKGRSTLVPIYRDPCSAGASSDPNKLSQRLYSAYPARHREASAEAGGSASRTTLPVPREVAGSNVEGEWAVSS